MQCLVGILSYPALHPPRRLLAMDSPNPHFIQEATFNNAARDYNDFSTTQVNNVFTGGSRHPLDRTRVPVS